MSTTHATLVKSAQSQLESENPKDDFASILHQVTLFEDKVKKFKDGYSVDTAQLMFAELSRRDPSAAGGVSSIAKLRRLSGDLFYASAEAGSEKLKQYFAWYLKNVEFLTELKKNFDRSIYHPLKKSAFVEDREPAASLGGATQPSSSSGKGRHDEVEDRQEKARVALLSFSADVPEILELYGLSKLEEVANRLGDLRSRWSALLMEENDIEPRLFSVESEEAVARPEATSWQASWVRLFSDVIVKCLKASSLCRQSIKLRRSERQDPAAVRLRKLSRIRSVLGARLRTVSESAAVLERRLEGEGADLEALLDREERSNSLSASLHGLRIDYDKLRVAAATVRKELDDTLDLLKTARKDADFYGKLSTTARLKRKRLGALEETMACVAYRKSIVEEDMALELNAKPSIIQFTNHLQERCEKGEQSLDSLQEEKSRLDSALTVVDRDIDTLAAGTDLVAGATSDL